MSTQRWEHLSCILFVLLITQIQIPFQQELINMILSQIVLHNCTQLHNYFVPREDNDMWIIASNMLMKNFGDWIMIKPLETQ